MNVSNALCIHKYSVHNKPIKRVHDTEKEVFLMKP